MSKEALKDAFVFTYDRMRRFQGGWHLEKRLMFPECVFLESDDGKALAEEWMLCGRAAGFSMQHGEIRRVQRSGEVFLASLCGHARHLGMSRGVIRDGRTRITEGPLRGMEERICRIDRHKRLARLEMPGGFASGGVLAGLEIVEKS